MVSQSWKGVPVVSANMDTTGTIATAIELAKHKCMTALNKFLTVEDYLALQKSNPEVLPYVAVSAGTAAYDTEMLSAILKAVPEVKVICLDGEPTSVRTLRSTRCGTHLAASGTMVSPPNHPPIFTPTSLSRSGQRVFRELCGPCGHHPQDVPRARPHCGERMHA